MDVFMEFFDVQFDTDKPMCNLETIIRDKNVPLFSEQQNSYLHFQDIKDFRNSEDDIVHMLEQL